jgi:hypothetical protein
LHNIPSYLVREVGNLHLQAIKKVMGNGRKINQLSSF